MTNRPTADITIGGKTKSLDLADFYYLVCYGLAASNRENQERRQREWEDPNERDAVLAEDARMNQLLRDLRDLCLEIPRKRLTNA